MPRWPLLVAFIVGLAIGRLPFSWDGSISATHVIGFVWTLAVAHYLKEFVERRIDRSKGEREIYLEEAKDVLATARAARACFLDLYRSQTTLKDSDAALVIALKAISLGLTNLDRLGLLTHSLKVEPANRVAAERAYFEYKKLLTGGSNQVPYSSDVYNRAEQVFSDLTLHLTAFAFDINRA